MIARFSAKLKAGSGRYRSRFCNTGNITVDAAGDNYATDKSSITDYVIPLASNEVIYLESLRKKGSSLLKVAADYQQ